MATNRREVISLVLYGDVEEQSLHDLAESVRFGLLANEDITYVEIEGTRPLEISVEVPQTELREHGLTLGGVAQAIRAASLESPGGVLDTPGGEVLLRTTERRRRGSEFEDVVLRRRPSGGVLRVGDVATVIDGFQENDQASYFHGQRAVRVKVFRTGDQGPIEVSEAVHAYAESLAGQLPPGVQATTWGDSAEMYRDRIDLLMRNAGVGLVLVLLVLSLFLEPRLAFWVTLGIPISFAGSVLFLPSAEVSINMISLFAFIVTLGMVVDDAIVVGEAIHERRSKGMSYTEAAVSGVKEVARPVVFSITTTCIAFSPMLFVPGVSGKFFRNIPIVVIAVLMISLVESLLVLPAHLAHKMPWYLRLLLSPLLLPMKLAHMVRADKALAWLIENTYKPALQAALHWRYLTFAIALALTLGTCGLPASGRLQFTFLPKIEGDVITAQLRMPVGTPVEETQAIHDRMIRLANERIDDHGGPDILRGLFSMVGTATGFGGGPRGGAGSSSGSHLTTVMLYLVQSDHRDVRTADLAKEWREAIGEIPGAEALTFEYSIGASAGKAVDIRLSHPDPETLEAASERLAQEMRTFSGLRDVDSGVSPGKEQIDLTLTAEGQARGLNAATLAQQLRASFYGAEALRQQRGRQEVRVYVRRPRSERTSLHELERLILRTPDGGEIPLGVAANLTFGRAYTSINRVDGRRVISATADIVRGVGNATEVVQQLETEQLPALLADFPGLSYELGGEQREQGRSLDSLKVGFAMAMLVMFGLLAIAFTSYVQPLIIMLGAIPFGVVGAFWGHVVLGFDLSMISLMGIVALSGVVVNDSLILIDAINHFRKEGYETWESVVLGGTRRFRPILLTSLTTFFGLVPMILEPSVQARFLVPMAISLGFGVLFATFILLLLVPAGYLIIEDLKALAAKGVGPLKRLYGDEDDEGTVGTEAMSPEAAE